MTAALDAFPAPVKKNGWPGAVLGCGFVCGPVFHATCERMVLMLTLQEVKEIVDSPAPGKKIPTAKKLKKTSPYIVRELPGLDAGVEVYPNGYVLYHANGYSTVFPINQCGKYLYGGQKGTCCMEECYFEKEAWYVRLILEGEDRLVRNQDAREQSRNISYSDLSENWLFFGEKGFSVLEKLVITELMEEMFRPLTGKQKEVVYLTYFGEKTQKQIAAELGISVAAVNQLLYMR